MKTMVQPLVDGQYAEFQAAVLRQLPRAIPADILEGWLDNQASLKKVLAEALLLPADLKSPVELAELQLQSWRDFYQKFFGIEIDTVSIKVPERKSGFDRLIVVSKGITLSQIIEVCRKQFQVWLYAEDLDKEITVNDRTNTETHALWVRDRVEADEENKNLSANDCKEKNIQGETLMERLLHGLKYFAETGKHLDVENVTLCNGSRCCDGGVPGVGWRPDSRKLRVGWYNPTNRGGNLRSREVVS